VTKHFEVFLSYLSLLTVVEQVGFQGRKLGIHSDYGCTTQWTGLDSDISGGDIAANRPVR